MASLAVLADDNPSWRPDRFGYGVLGTKVELRFPTAKLLDYEDRWDLLESSPSLFAAVVMAHPKALETGNDPENRYRWKLCLIKRLYRMGCGRGDVVLLFEFIDWIMSMPEELEDGLWNEIREMERENRMEYITNVERIGRRVGCQEGVADLFGRLLSKKLDLCGWSAIPPLRGARGVFPVDQGSNMPYRHPPSPPQGGNCTAAQPHSSKKFNIGRRALAPMFEGLTAEQIEELAEFFMEARTLEEIRERADEMRMGES